MCEKKFFFSYRLTHVDELVDGDDAVAILVQTVENVVDAVLDILLLKLKTIFVYRRSSITLLRSINDVVQL